MSEMATPNKFTEFPFGSVTQNHEAEQVAKNIMIILARNGNTFRLLGFGEYKVEREKDGNFTAAEEVIFHNVVMYTETEKTARLFSPGWRAVQPQPLKAEPRYVGMEDGPIEDAF